MLKPFLEMLPSLAEVPLLQLQLLRTLTYDHAGRLALRSIPLCVRLIRINPMKSNLSGRVRLHEIEKPHFSVLTFSQQRCDTKKSIRLRPFGPILSVIDRG